MNLPTFEDVADKKRRNALEQFIYDEEPAGPFEKEFRNGLKKVLMEANKVPDITTFVQTAGKLGIDSSTANKFFNLLFIKG